MPNPSLLPFPDSGTGSLDYWRGQVEWAAEIRQKKLKQWRTNAAAYLGELEPTEVGGIRVNIEFEKTEQKRPQLFFRLPALKLRPTPRTIRDSYPVDPMVGQPDPTAPPVRDLKKAVAILREVLDHLMGPKGANTKALMDELIFDVLCPSGIAFAKIGYQRFTSGTVPMQVGQQPDPNYQQPGAILKLRPVPMVPVMGTAPNIVCEQYYASRISPARGLIPPEFMGSDYNKADWLAYDFFVTADVAKKNGWAIEGAEIQGSDRNAVDQDDRIIKLDETGRRTGQIQCRELFYYPANLGLDDNPDRLRRIVFAGGQIDPVVHEDFKDQQFTPRGKWTGGLKTHPIKVLTLRYVSDTAYPPSDCTITRRAADELSEFRSLQMKHRRKAVPRSAVDGSRFINDKMKDKYLENKSFDDIVVDGSPVNIAVPITPPNLPPDQRHSEQEIKNDIDRSWALVSPVQEGSTSTATEIAAKQQAASTRQGGEREQTMKMWLSIAEGFGGLVQMYADREEFVEIAGEAGAKQIEAWSRATVSGEFLYDTVPDSSLPPDGAADRDQALNWHNLVANDPYFDKEENARQLAEAFGRDPERLVHPPAAPPPPPPEKPKINLAVNGKDLDPSVPQYQNVVNVLLAAGIPADQLQAAALHATPPPPGTNTVGPGAGPSPPIKPAPVIDRERLQLENKDHRVGGLVGVGTGRQ